MPDRITIRKPDDWHLHVRDNDMLKAALPFTARHFGRAILMPNLIPPVRTTADAIAYRERVMAALPTGSTFKPLLTCYLTDDTDPDDVERGFREGVFTGVKLYPANATTNSAAGVTDYRRIKPVLARMEKIGMRFERETIVPAHGQIPGPPGTLTQADLAVAGPMARTVADLDLALGLMSGPDRWNRPAVCWT